jgi:hypothetical protein
VPTALIGAIIGAVAVGAVVLAGAVRHHPSASRETGSTEAGSPEAPSPTAGHQSDEPSGSVFLEHLPKCTQTDHHSTLTVAFTVNNLGAGPLVLLGAAPLTGGDDALRLTRVRLGADACAGDGGARPVRLARAGSAVVAMSFRVGARCPDASPVAARVTFDAGPAGIVHADSSALTDLSRLAFAQC